MRRPFLITLLLLFLASCAQPVFKKDVMQQASNDLPPLRALKADPGPYTGKLYLLGGRIVNTKLTERGSIIQAIYVPVDEKGHLKDIEDVQGRYLAFLPHEEGLLDPEIYEKGREITMAAEFAGTRKGKLDDIELTYPYFVIERIHLWEEEVYMPYYGPSYYSPWSSPYYPYYWDHRYPYWWDDPRWRFGTPPPPFWYP